MRIALNTKEIQTALQHQQKDRIIRIGEETKAMISHIKFNDMKRFLEISESSIKIAQKKLSKDFDQVVLQFNETLKIAIQKSRDFVAVVNQETQEKDSEDLTENAPLLQQNRSRIYDASFDSQIELNEKIIAEREEDLVGLEKSIAEVNEIFRDFGTLVNEQQYLLDNIENNVNNVSIHMQGATSELRQASNYQNSTGKTYLWVFLILLVIAAIVILSLQPWNWKF